MSTDKKAVPIVIADDNQADCVLMRAAFSDAKVPNPLLFVRDGQELVETLHRQLAGGEPAGAPGLILMDLNMPRLDGKQTLRVLRGDPQLRHLPVIIVSTSAFHEEVLQCYKLGANSFLVKPFDYDEFVKVLAATADYWLNKVELPLGR